MVTKGERWRRGTHWQIRADTFTLLYLKHNQREPAVVYRELCPMFYNNTNGKIILKTIYIYTHTYIYIIKSVCYTPETNTILQINYS